ncbi:hypothetical protein BC936DRAFT_148931 [Jimgerdemannia flammicorona]|uniref:EF-hand domain-containing protein n=1 Tax=Jimgerdemannia flammicorona TaxID=994334 RepID=A0A433D1Y9_9FUNG|nr:hypothetical protein BC936DRAFT_148931 [Jimgerdemannia flammicorona]
MPAELLDDDDQLTEKLERVLTEIFRRFDKDNDGALNTKELEEYALATNGQEVCVCVLLCGVGLRSVRGE